MPITDAMARFENQEVRIYIYTYTCVQCVAICGTIFGQKPLTFTNSSLLPPLPLIPFLMPPALPPPLLIALLPAVYPPPLSRSDRIGDYDL